ncbi:MAG TPA: hypothetical protein VFA07_00805 [Chthonomonadaceae bacterium]|nr:hypothetical protein [Chthonomonadaceae bacterium]
MGVHQLRYSKEEAARRETEIYERDIRPQVEADNKGNYVAIHIETGIWEMDADEIAASDRLLAHHPDAQIGLTRVSFGYIRRFGAECK